MTYRATNKRKKLWSQRSLEKQERQRLARDPEPYAERIDHDCTITIDRHSTGEKAVFELREGTRIDNYTVYVNGERKGVMGITAVCNGIRKALPSFRACHE